MPDSSTAAIIPVRTAVVRPRQRVARWFYIGAALFVMLVSLVGFAPSIVDQSRRNAPLTSIVIGHGAAAASWLVLFLAQSLLVATGRTSVHRRVGRIGPVLAAVMVGLGVLMLVEDAHRGYDLSGDLARGLTPLGSPQLSVEESAPGLVFPLSGFVSFGILVAAGWLCRRRPETHKRLMLFALFPLVGEPVIHLIGHLAAHWPALQGTAGIIAPVASLVLLSVSAIHDKMSQGRIHPVSLWVPVLLLVWVNAVPAIVFPSTLWHNFAVWFTQ